MKIALLKKPSKTKGGLEKYTDYLAEAFKKKGHDVSIISPPAPKFYPRFYRLLTFDQKCKQAVIDLKPDVIFSMDRVSHQTHMRAGNGVHRAFLSQRLKLEPFFKKLYFHLSPLHRSLLTIEKKAFESPQLKTLFCNSHMVKEEILRYFKTDPKKIEVIHNGVEYQSLKLPFSKWHQERKKILKAIKLPDTFHFLFIGNGFERKGLVQLLLALSKVKSEFHLSVVGKDKNSKWFHTFTKKLGLEKKVRFFGQQKNVLPFYQLADALVIPSFYDPFANVTLEALAMGLFVVTSKHNGGKEVLNTHTGLVIDDLYSQNSFTKSLKQALTHPKTAKSSKLIRSSVKDYDFSIKLSEMVDQTLCVS